MTTKSTLAQIFFVLLPTLTSQNLRADINIKDGSYTKKAKDTDFIERTYQSRSLHSGLFGFGWCSNLEIKIQRFGTEKLRLIDCNLQSEIEFKFSTKIGKKNNSLIGPPGWIARMNGDNSLSVSFKGRNWQFNSEGQLIEFDNRFKVHYQNSLILEIEDKKRQQIWRLTWGEKALTPSPKIVAVTMEGNPAQGMSYIFKNDDLVEVKNRGQKKIASYVYDTFHNLLEVSSNEENLKLKYDDINDLAIEISDSNCITKIDYTNLDPTHSSNHLQKICNNKIVQNITYDFWYEALPLEHYLLVRVKIQEGKNSKSINLTPNRIGALIEN